MKKKIELVLDFLAKSKDSSKEQQVIYQCIQERLVDEKLCFKTLFSTQKISLLLEKKVNSNFEGENFFKKNLLKEEKKELEIYLKNIQNTLLSSNFPSHSHLLKIGLAEFEASLNKVEAKIYTMIRKYIKNINLSLKLFVTLDEKREKSIQEITNFAKEVHEDIIKNLFYKQELDLIKDALTQLLTIYIGVYINFYYIKRSS